MGGPFEAAMGSVLADLRKEFKRASRTMMRDLAEDAWSAAWRKFGTYTGNPSWPQLAPFTQADREAQGFTPNDPLLRTGDLRESVMRRHGIRWAEVGTDDPVMIYHELGTWRMPPRPVFGPVVTQQAEQFRNLIDLNMRSILEKHRMSYSVEASQTQGFTQAEPING